MDLSLDIVPYSINLVLRKQTIYYKRKYRNWTNR